MVEQLWAKAAVGFIGGPPKCCKSYLGLQIAVSVASGTRCLGTYAVPDPGPTLIYLAEDSLQDVRQRVAGLAKHQGLDLTHLAVHVITASRLRLDQRSDLEKLVQTVRQLRPRLLLLDPMVRLHAVDENNACEVAKLLSSLRALQRRFDMAVILVHHTRKMLPPGVQPGQGLRGSTDLHAFGDSNLYLRRTRDQLVLSIEHRAAAAAAPVGLELITTDQDSVHLRLARPPHPDQQRTPPTKDLAQAILDKLHRRHALPRQTLRQQLAVKNQTLGIVLKDLERQGRIERVPDGWRLPQPPVPVPPIGG